MYKIKKNLNQRFQSFIILLIGLIFSYEVKSQTYEVNDQKLKENLMTLSVENGKWSSSTKIELFSLSLESNIKLVSHQNELYVLNDTDEIQVLISMFFNETNMDIEVSKNYLFEKENSFFLSHKDKFFSFTMSPKDTIYIRALRAHPYTQMIEYSNVIQVQILNINHLKVNNVNFDSSKVTLQTSLYSLYSKDQIKADKENSLISLARIGWEFWFQEWGSEIAIQSKVANFNKSSRVATASPFLLETSLRRRWSIEKIFFSTAKRSQYFIAFSYLYYRNSESEFTSPKYDLLKLALKLEVPFLQNWTANAEIAYGLGFEKSNKSELTSFLNYFLQPNWSLGLGYKLHFFEAGSIESTPQKLPYREGAEEASVRLDWYY